MTLSGFTHKGVFLMQEKSDVYGAAVLHLTSSPSREGVASQEEVRSGGSVGEPGRGICHFVPDLSRYIS